MGMVASIHQVTTFQLKRIIQSPELVDKWIFPEDDADQEEMLVDDGLYFGRSLFGLNFFMTGYIEGGEPPISYAIFGKHLLFENDWGMHSCNYLMPNEVEEVWSALREITKHDLLSQFDVDVMNEIPIYPSATWEDSDFDYLYDLFEKMTAYYEDAVHNGNAMIHLVY